MEFYGDNQVYSGSGIDLTLLRENLHRSIEDRLVQNRKLLTLAEALSRSDRTPALVDSNKERPAMADFDAAALLRQLARHQVEFVLIGGLAMIAHGSASITQDLDICYSRTAQNLAAVSAALAPINPYLRGAPPGLPFRFDVSTIQAGLNFTLSTDLGDIDFLGEVPGVGGYPAVFSQSEERTIFGLTIRVLSLDGLIAAKKAAGRAKDRIHLLELEELKKMRDAAP
jgi:hypothetical protein